MTVLCFAFRITESLIYGTMVIGAAVAFSPDMNKAFVAARRVFGLIDRKPLIDSSTEAGLKLVSDHCAINALIAQLTATNNCISQVVIIDIQVNQDVRVFAA